MRRIEFQNLTPQYIAGIVVATVVVVLASVGVAYMVNSYSGKLARDLNVLDYEFCEKELRQTFKLTQEDGYLLSNEALSRIGSKLNENYTFCRNSGTEGKL